jgi:hypothetical protein
MDFVWNDGGRAASGFVGLAGDCVTRAIAIAMGAVYRDIYEELGQSALKSPRDGVRAEIASDYLQERGWQRSDGFGNEFVIGDLPRGVVVVHLGREDETSQHLCTVIDHVVHDTWNPGDDDDYIVNCYWTSQEVSTALPVTGPKRRISKEQELTQREFDKVMKLLRALDNTASNGASTEGEKRNALRMMQSLMLRHNLSRDDIVDDDDVNHVQFTRMACPVNGRRACGWEKDLARYVTQHIFPTIQWYRSTKGHRTFFWFYGPLADVQNGIALFRELLLTIATAVQLQYGSHMRGSGASYAEGYVAGLPRSGSDTAEQDEQVLSQRALIQTRTLALRSAADQWLDLECNIRLSKSGSSGRWNHDDVAESRGKRHGAQHKVTVPGSPKRITRQ